MDGEVKSNIERVLSAVAAAAERRAQAIGREHTVTVVAATKTQSAELVNTAVSCGVADVGENRVQEFLAKRDAVKGARWHFIGTLQRNKVKYVVGEVALIQSVSSVALAEEIERICSKRGIVQDVLAELNAGDELGKTGARPCEIHSLIERMAELRHIRLRGLMAVPPKNAPDAVYDTIYRVYKAHESADFSILSVGMSGDYEKAIEKGSNMVRLGTALFGAREYTK